jgi:adenylate cyclase
VRAAETILRRCRETHARLQDPEQHLLFRLGIATGLAVVGNVGTSELFNYTAIGDTVNLAQRLQVAARPGQILMYQATYQAVSSQVTARQLPPLTVKGRARPVEVYELKGVH